MSRTLALAAVLVAIVANRLAPASAQCYSPQRSGCGSGADFCKKGAKVCDIGFSTTPRTGGGKEFGGGDTVNRKCFKLCNVLTSPCPPGEASPGPGWIAVGCSQNGVCCSTDRLDETFGGEGSMGQPTGEPCSN